MNASTEATEFRLATDIVFGLLSRCSTPIASQASRKICRMSLEVFVKRYLGYRYRSPQTRLITRQPSEWIRPRSSWRG